MSMLTLSNDDIFISYCRSDATTYSDGLATELTKKNFIPFTDALGTDASPDLPGTLIHKLNRCRMLVILGSPHACHSVAVTEEIRLFTKAKGGTSGIILIDFGETVNNASWKELVVGLRREKEPLQALVTGNPSPAIVNRIEKAFTYRKSKDRIKNYIRTAAIILGLLVVAIAGATWYATRQLQKAQRQEKVAAALRYANESQAMLQDPDLIIGSVQKAIQSGEILDSLGQSSLVVDNALRSSLALMPLLTGIKTYPGKEYLLAADGRLIERRYADTGWLFFKQDHNQPFFRLKGAGSMYDDNAVMSISNDGQYIAVGYTKVISIYNTADTTHKEYIIQGEDWSVGKIAISPNGKYLAMSLMGDEAGDFDWIKIWNTTNDSVVEVATRAVNVNAISFSVSGASLVMGCRGFDDRGNHSGVALIWDITDIDERFNEQLFDRPHVHAQQAEITGIAAGKDYAGFATVQDAHVMVWKLKPGNVYQPVSYIPNKAFIYDMAIQADNRELTIVKSLQYNYANGGDIVERWDYHGYTEADKWYAESQIDRVAFADRPQGAIYSVHETADAEATSRLWYWPGQRRQADSALSAHFPMNALRYYTPDLAWIVTVSDSLHVWNYGLLKQSVPVDKKAKQILQVTITPDGQWLAWVQHDEQQKGKGILVRLDGKGYREPFTFPVEKEVSQIAIASGGAALMLMSENHEVTSWDVQQNEAKKIKPDSTLGPVHFIKPGPGADLACIGTSTYNSVSHEEKHYLHIWDMKTDRIVTSVRLLASLNSCSWSPDGKMLMYGDAGRVGMINREENKITQIMDSTSDIGAMAFSASGRYVGIGTVDRVARIFETATLNETAQVNTEGKIVDIVFSKDDRYVATASNNTSFLDLSYEGNHVIQSWPLLQADLLKEAKRRLKALEQLR
jgi:WD40 repeat protein